MLEALARCEDEANAAAEALSGVEQLRREDNDKHLAKLQVCNDIYIRNAIVISFFISLSLSHSLPLSLTFEKKNEINLMI